MLFMGLLVVNRRAGETARVCVSYTHLRENCAKCEVGCMWVTRWRGGRGEGRGITIRSIGWSQPMMRSSEAAVPVLSDFRKHGLTLHDERDWRGMMPRRSP